ncbi:GcrA family cell cycle regulator [Promicromonospora iranensis]|uniref:Homeodomain-like domain-containing protein n=1 Tax=Promicromonospora iranensis TaxID=1105144 RepID=A0ABU2CV54_9MICO|nr:GcrA family cell cycle regulator [Promicromonospora iranensis]MDR7385223.1 hypothetical protein [Promicromonospora iranensis]
MAAGPYTPDEDATLRRLIPQGISQSEIGRQIGRTRGSVANRAAKLGLRSDRTDTVRATEAKVIDAKARRAKLELALLEDAEEMRRRMFAPTTVYNFGGKDNTYNEREVDEPPHADKLKLMQAAGIAIDRSLKIAEHDSDTGVVEAVGALDQIADAMAEVAKTLPDMGPDQ